MNRFVRSVLIGASIWFFGITAAQAQEGETASAEDAAVVDDLVEEDTPPTCLQALKSCAGDGIGKAFKEARTQCKALRSCKSDCRAGKREAKGEVRDAFQECVDACKGDKECKKACKKEKRDAKKEVRGDKRDCNSACRDEFKTEGCSAARKELAKALGKCAAKAGAPCTQALQSLKAEEPPAE
jgi:hypothetical protein